MAAPTVTWMQISKTSATATHTSIASLDFGTVTAGAWSPIRCIRPKVAGNTVQSAKWWLSDVLGVRSAAAETMGTAQSWKHFMTQYATYSAAVSDYAAFTSATPLGSAGVSGSMTEMPESTGSAVAYSAVAPGYGDFVLLSLYVPSAAGDGAHTAWGYQLKYSYT